MNPVEQLIAQAEALPKKWRDDSIEAERKQSYSDGDIAYHFGQSDAYTDCADELEASNNTLAQALKDALQENEAIKESFAASVVQHAKDYESLRRDLERANAKLAAVEHFAHMHSLGYSDDTQVATINNARSFILGAVAKLLEAIRTGKSPCYCDMTEPEVRAALGSTEPAPSTTLESKVDRLVDLAEHPPLNQPGDAT